MEKDFESSMIFILDISDPAIIDRRQLSLFNMQSVPMGHLREVFPRLSTVVKKKFVVSP